MQGVFTQGEVADVVRKEVDNRFVVYLDERDLTRKWRVCNLGCNLGSTWGCNLGSTAGVQLRGCNVGSTYDPKRGYDLGSTYALRGAT